MNKLTLSLALNAALLLTAAFFAFKRFKFQYDSEHPKTFASYLDNPQYIEQTKIMAGYHEQAKIVMLGNSHFFKAHWSELLQRGDVANRGIGSDITEGFLHRLQYVFDCHPAICFIEGGTNDLGRHIPDAVIVSHLSAIVDTLRKANIIPVLHTVLMAAKSFEDADCCNKKSMELNDKIKQLAADKHVELIDLNPTLAPQGYLLSSYAQADGGHLTGAAYDIWAGQMRAILEVNRI